MPVYASSVSSAWAQTCWPRIKPFLHFTAQKKVTLVDWRLGLSLWLLKGLIFIYICFTLFVERRYLYQEVPLGFLEATGLDDGRFMQAQQEAYVAAFVENRTDTMCNTARLQEYDYVFDEFRNFTFSKCNWPTASAILNQSPGSLFVGLQLKTVVTESLPSDHPFSPNCQHIFEEAGVLQSCHARGGSPQWIHGDQSGRCVCESSVYSLHAGAENVSVSVAHAFSTSFGAGQQTHTVLRRKGSTENLKVWEAGELVTAYLWEFLEWAQVDLDLPINEGRNRQWMNELQYDSESTQGSHGKAAGKYPRLRVMGMKLSFHLKYYNYQQAPHYRTRRKDSIDYLVEPDVVCIIEIEPHLSWTAMGSNVLHTLESDQTRELSNHGILFTFKVSGFLGTFDFFLLVSALTSLLVFLDAANYLVAFIAQFGMGLKNNFNKRSINERVVFDDEYSTYAAKTVAAVAMMDLMDKDKSAFLDIPELYRQMRKVHIQSSVSGEVISREESRALVGFLMNKSDREGDETRAHESDGTWLPKLTCDEWTTAFIGTQCNMHTFKKYIQRHMDEFEIKNKQMLVRLDAVDLDLDQNFQPVPIDQLASSRLDHGALKAGKSNSVSPSIPKNFGGIKLPPIDRSSTNP